LLERARIRLTALLVAIALAFGVVAIRLVDLQVFSRAALARDAVAQRLIDVAIPATRGAIYDRSGVDLALDVPREFVYADPALVLQDYRSDYARSLAPILGVDARTIYDRLAAGTTPGGDPLRFRYLSLEPLTDAQLEQVRTLDLPGVATRIEPHRAYPAGDLAAPVLGTVHREGDGLQGDLGIEALYDEDLTGEAGRASYERDTAGREIPHSRRDRRAAMRGTDLVLTIDRALQYHVEQTLADQVSAQAAKFGIAIVVDVQTGDILAMANVRGSDDVGSRAAPADANDRNRAITDVFEPGSTNKIITIATALESGCVERDTWFQVDGWIENGDKVIRDDQAHGLETWTTAEILARSSNVGTAMIAAQCLTPTTMDAAMRAFGYGTSSGLRFPSEAAGLLRPPDEYYASGLRSAAIGYGVATSAIQVLDVYTTIANGGRTRPPRLVRSTMDGERGQRELEVAPGRRVVSADTARQITEMLLAVVATGTAPCAAVTGYEIAGKSGTANKVGPDGRYISGANVASFVGFAPATAPRLATIVVLDEPGDDYGGRTAAPVFSEIMRFALRQQGVAPAEVSTTPPQWEVAAATAADREQSCAVPHDDDLDRLLAARADAQRRAQEEQEAAARAAEQQAAAPGADPEAAAGTVATTEPPDE
jgi:cell division protein FtsI (penicillin-binding protein 3)